MGQEPFETTFVAAGPLRTHSYPAAVDVRWASTTHVRAAARAVESVSYVGEATGAALTTSSRAATTRASNCVPAFACSSPQACWGDIARR